MKWFLFIKLIKSDQVKCWSNTNQQKSTSLRVVKTSTQQSPHVIWSIIKASKQSDLNNIKHTSSVRAEQKGSGIHTWNVFTIKCKTSANDCTKQNIRGLLETVQMFKLWQENKTTFYHIWSFRCSSIFKSIHLT